MGQKLEPMDAHHVRWMHVEWMRNQETPHAKKFPTLEYLKLRKK
jgi:hypothetical protein